ncbi:hypothetical protein CONLIGDRAFT_680593 [Coniochaeta ligniaria NRRL 30616]|uniref:Uncharacterized protein n=1 Tax=Coniochaeta ligniaria NRRL 30616 TaxID=1408157 RepID=A0A1J7JPV6_9PEZI|nr:hypothetical protein CONLIGDRAFT_680593 [Coniochaeta ligniaria NRRL 30616]
MSSQRSILAPVSRKAKHASQQMATVQADVANNKATSATHHQLNSAKARRKKNSSGVGMFGSWFEESPDYDEEEDSKTWEQPWALPPTPLSPLFSPPTPTLTPPQSSRKSDHVEKPRNVKPQVEKKQAEKPQRQAQTTAKPARAEAVEPRDVHRGTGKQDRKSKAKSGAKHPKTATKAPVNPPTSSPSVSTASVKPVTAVQQAGVKIILKKRTNLFSLPLEVRDNIYGHLLTAATPITVMRGWTQCGARYRGGLEPAILQVCRQTYEEGIRILYSSNTFLYLIRDTGEPIQEALRPEGYLSPMAISLLEPPPLSELKSANAKGRAAKRRRGDTKAKPVVKKSTVGDVNRVIYLAKYAHLFRRVEIVLESNRDDKQYRLAMAKAIQLLGNEGGFGANLTSLQFSLTPVERELGRPGSDAGTEWTVVKFFSSAQNAIADAIDRADGAPTDGAPTDGAPTDGAPTDGAPTDETKTKPVKKENYDVMDALRNLNVRLLHFTVYTPSSRRLDMTLDMTYRTSPDELGRLLAHDNLVAQQRQETAKASSEAFRNLRLLIREACADTDKAVKDGWWTEYGPPQVAAVRSAMEGLDTIKERMRKYRSPWYEKVRRDYAAQPEHACCVRKVGRKLQPTGE